tara:strand:+ start:2771 stop:3457 length:687 start_codon:yes stop_codon:yes gene_type:complete
MRICFLAKKDKPGVKEASDYLKKNNYELDEFYGDLSDDLPKGLLINNYDIIISYISPWIVPKKVLEKTKYWNLNFHPGPPEYPGIGCFNFAIYDEVTHFGSTAHIMNSKVDTGKIIGVKRFKMEDNEDVVSLSKKTYKVQIELFLEIMSYISKNNSLPSSNEKWRRLPYKRTELESLSEIKIDMDTEEIKKRINATYFPGKPPPFICLGNHIFEYNENSKRKSKIKNQ